MPLDAYRINCSKKTHDRNRFQYKNTNMWLAQKQLLPLLLLCWLITFHQGIWKIAKLYVGHIDFGHLNHRRKYGMCHVLHWSNRGVSTDNLFLTEFVVNNGFSANKSQAIPYPPRRCWVSCLNRMRMFEYAHALTFGWKPLADYQRVILTIWFGSQLHELIIWSDD
jgi:hypothetical protein